jgi:hypothetical protein
VALRAGGLHQLTAGPIRQVDLLLPPPLGTDDDERGARKPGDEKHEHQGPSHDSSCQIFTPVQPRAFHQSGPGIIIIG